ncbi:MAG TPA: acyl-CoA dehydrogenase family protein, partial [Solirubrobacteraceae bacterium]|nr:acyl-CoA dehydrogenase family protein [Solirubrobacteraceae bacterium]
MPRLDLTPQEMIDRATALRPLLREQSAETEQRTVPSEEIHQACVEAGFYRLYIPRRYGGYEFGAPTFMRVVQELSRGDISAGWCIALAAAHALQVASWWPEQAQDEIFGDGDFRCAAVAAPIGPAARSDDGWELNGKVGYCSGIPIST